MERTACTNEDTWHAYRVNSIKPRGSRSKPRIISWNRPSRSSKKSSTQNSTRPWKYTCVSVSIASTPTRWSPGALCVPNGLGKSKRVLVITSGDKLRKAQEAGADFVGGEDMVNKIQSEGWTDFDAVIATPDMMRSV